MPRRSSSYLLRWRLKEATMKRYDIAVQDMVKWARRHGEHAATVEELDELICDYIHYLYETGGSKSAANNTINGVVNHMPQFRKRFHRARAAAAGWSRKHVGISYPPITRELMAAVAMRLAYTGRHDMAVATHLSFDCFLRIGELCNLRVRNIAVDGDDRIAAEHRGMMVSLDNTKTGRDQAVRVHDPQVERLMEDMLRGKSRHSNALLFPFSTATYWRHFKNACAHLGLDRRLTTHSLRHGGATRWHHVLGRSLEQVSHRLRHASLKSSIRYIQSGVALLMQRRAPQRIVRAGGVWCTDIRRHLALAQRHYAGLGTLTPQR
jgi:integrase